ncbi:MAG: hypothetical protein AUG51_02000 [Acidobacteria bacterium 13_1_20CM_3_53_8]|nr:MAG: hypothetical protein AUG51_02000 [Acidobacteria bacterium 13_1_20CM_3_53_8]
MQPLNSQPDERTIAARLRTLRILWFAILCSIGLFFLLTIFIGKRPHTSSETDAVSFVFMAVGASSVLASVIVKMKLLARAFETQRIENLVSAFIVSFALTEVAGILGLLDFLVTGERYYYLLFVLAAVGMLLHVPKREHVISASYRSRI